MAHSFIIIFSVGEVTYCSECGKSYKSNASLRNHKSLYHRKEKRLQQHLHFWEVSKSRILFQGTWTMILKAINVPIVTKFWSTRLIWKFTSEIIIVISKHSINVLIVRKHLKVLVVFEITKVNITSTSCVFLQ